MTASSTRRQTVRIRDRLRSIVRGSSDQRVRVTWRVLLAMPVLWVLTGDVLAGNVQSTVAWIPSGRGPAAGLAQSLLHGGFFLAALVAWARYLDRRPLSEYGMSASRRWVLHLFVGFGAVVVGFLAWLALGAVLGATTVSVSQSASGGSFLLGLVLLIVALAVHAAIQQIVFFRVVLESASDGLSSGGIAGLRGIAGALVVAVLLFTAMHGDVSGLRVLDLFVAGAVFGLLYLHTGDLALGIGAHFGALYAGAVLFPAPGSTTGPTVFLVTGSLPGILGTVNRYGFPKMVVAYLVLVAWLRWRRGGVSVRTRSTRAAG